MNADDIWIKEDKQFWDGFGVCLELIKSVFNNSPEKESEGLWDEIEEEIEFYKFKKTDG